MSKQKLYVKYSDDKYKLPEFCADTVKELAEIVGTTSNSIYSSLSQNCGTYGRFYFEEGDEVENCEKAKGQDIQPDRRTAAQNQERSDR